VTRGPASPPSAGFTLLELLAVIVLLLVVAGIGFQIIQMTGSATASTVFQTELDQRVHRTLDRIVRELQGAEGESFAPDPSGALGASTLTYRSAEVSDADEVVWGAYRRLELVPEASDPLDGIDNDSDGLVDEHVLRLVHDVDLPSERTAVLARNVAPLLEGETGNSLDDNGNQIVDEAGLSLALRDGIVYVRLSLQGRNPRGHILTRTAETTVWPRN